MIHTCKALFILLLCLPAFVHADRIATNKTAAPQTDSMAMPAALLQRLDTLRKEDNLEEWIFVNLDYAAEEPVTRLPFLMSLQQRAWRTPENGFERAAWLDMLTYQGYYQLYTGNILPSITAYEAAYRYYNESPITETDVLEYILKPLGNNYTRLGDYERASFIHSKMIAIAQERNDVRQVAAAYGNLAVAEQMREQYGEALQHAFKGLVHAQVPGLLHSTIADVYLQMGKTDSAALHAASAVRLLKRGKGENAGYWLASALQVSGDIAYSQQRYRAADVYFRKASAVMDKYYPGARNREKARLLVKMGRNDLRYKTSTPHFDKAIALLVPGVGGWPRENQLYGEFTLADALEGKADAALLMREDTALKNVTVPRLEDALKGYMLIFSVEQRLRREFFSRTTRLLHQRHSRALSEKAMNVAYRLWERTGDAKYTGLMLEIMERSKAQVLLEELQSNMQNSRLTLKDTLLDKQRRLQQAIAYYDRELALQDDANARKQSAALAYELSLVQEQLKEKYPAYFGKDAQAKPFRPEDLPEGLIAKSFFSGDEHLYIIDLQRSGIRSVRRLAGGAEKQAALRSFVERYFHNGPQAMQNDPRAYYHDAYRIFSWLWNDTVAAKQYLLVPDGRLGYIPFDALPTDSIYRRDVAQWPFLLKKAATGLAYSLQTWWQQQQQVSTAQGITGFFISKAAGGTELPAVAQEYEAVQRRMKGRYFRNEAATLAVFREQLGNGGILHLSTHAALLGDQQLPAIQLADGPFFLFELYARRFHPGLIMLSACRTGQGMLAEGEGIISLAREFTASGATGIVAGLWNVHDAAAAKLTGDFYEQLPDAESPMMALHQAKLEWLGNKDTKQQLKLPYYWAALTYIGHHHAVAVEKPGGGRAWYWFVLLTVAGLVMLYVRIRRK
ncbi:CHAT domain-containing protein [Chitinophaga sp. XS-30]|uniref:CHAT domain-containing protein n=1 Tax=Chitinophaga sp. XS-30 TaxID=2604421 RepID=UPI0011DE43FA|nr:CHAT domain-containing protein [Chitinophaga sp. XS-30]QEH40823.1 CHAT domain-containing protein [Chitinophaga sp. XS-30]